MLLSIRVETPNTVYKRALAHRRSQMLLLMFLMFVSMLVLKCDQGFSNLGEIPLETR